MKPKVSYKVSDIYQNLVAIGSDSIFERRILLFCYYSTLDELGLEIRRGDRATLDGRASADVYVASRGVEFFVTSRPLARDRTLTFSGVVEWMERYLLWKEMECGEPRESEYEPIESCRQGMKDEQDRDIYGYVIDPRDVTISLYSE